MRNTICSVFVTFAVCPIFLWSQVQAPANAPDPPNGAHSVTFFIYERARGIGWDWYEAPPYENSYGYGESLLRFGLSQIVGRWDWKLEITQPTILDAPNDSVSAKTAQGQLGLGATYYAANGNNSWPVAAFLKQGFARYNFAEDGNVRLGRIEWVEGLETKPKNPTIAWLQHHRVAQRLIGNFGFTNAQRSFDGIDAHYGEGSWDITTMFGRADQGVFNMNGNPELNVDIQYLAFTKSNWNDHFLWRVFGIGYHDGRTGITKTDNRALAVRQTDHRNIRLGTYGADFMTAIPAGSGQFDFMGWGALQNGRWGYQQQSSNAAAVEGGYQFLNVTSTPWIRGGWWRGSGDNNPNDGTHGTFVELLPTPRVYARTPIYNLMNLTDEFVQVIDRPNKKWDLRSDLHWLQLTSSKDLWYQGGGAFDNKVFGFTGRPSNGHSSFNNLWDISSDWHATPHLEVNLYYGHAWGKTVVQKIYPAGQTAQLFYLELIYRWESPLSH